MCALSPKATSETSLTPDPAGPADQGVHKLSALAEFLASAIDEGMAFSISDLRNSKSLQRAIRRCVALADPQKIAAWGGIHDGSDNGAGAVLRQASCEAGIETGRTKATRSRGAQLLTDQIVRAIIR